MKERTPQWCVFLPCSENEIWAVPQNCLGEIVTIPNAQELPPEHITWRGHSLPVLDLNVDSASPWREPHGGAGKIAVILGLQGLGCDYWGVALRGDGLAMNPLVDDQVEEASQETLEHTLGAFRHRDQLYQIPDLEALQKQLSSHDSSAPLAV